MENGFQCNFRCATLKSGYRMCTDSQWNEMIKRSKKKHCQFVIVPHDNNWNVFLIVDVPQNLNSTSSLSRRPDALRSYTPRFVPILLVWP